MASFTISGNTFAVKDQIKAIGGKWSNGSWLFERFTAEQLTAAQAIPGVTVAVYPDAADWLQQNGFEVLESISFTGRNGAGVVFLVSQRPGEVRAVKYLGGSVGKPSSWMGGGNDIESARQHAVGELQSAKCKITSDWAAV
jgi:hypothetical protein